MLSSAASILRAIPKRPGEQGIILAGCEDGTVVGVESSTVIVLWKVNISDVCGVRKSQAFKSYKGNQGASVQHM